MDFLYPERCLGCGVPDAWICPSCRDGIPVFGAPRDAPLLPSGRVPSVKRVFAVSAYAEPLWNECIRALKYERLVELVPYLRPVLSRYRTVMTPHWNFAMGEGWTIAPIPTAPDHIEDRGGDHMESWSMLLLELLPEATIGAGVLRRQAIHHAQASFVTKGAREQAMEQGFIVRGCVPQRVLLLDDVYTTGATMQAAAEAFLKAGTQEVQCFVAAFSQANKKM